MKVQANASTNLTLRERVCTGVQCALMRCSGKFYTQPRGSPGEAFQPAWSVRRASSYTTLATVMASCPYFAQANPSAPRPASITRATSQLFKSIAATFPTPKHDTYATAAPG